MFAFGENIPIIFYNVPLFGHFSWKKERKIANQGKGEGEERKEKEKSGRFFEEDGEGLLVAEGVYHLRFYFQFFFIFLFSFSHSLSHRRLLCVLANEFPEALFAPQLPSLAEICLCFLSEVWERGLGRAERKKSSDFFFLVVQFLFFDIKNVEEILSRSVCFFLNIFF